MLGVVVIGGAFGGEALFLRRTGRVVRSDASIAGGNSQASGEAGSMLSPCVPRLRAVERAASRGATARRPGAHTVSASTQSNVLVTAFFQLR